jgi:S1-C subfamily serine protease
LYLDCTVKYEIVNISSVEPNSYAEALGFAVGDVVKSVSVDGVAREITGVYQAPEMLLAAREGSTVVYTVIRDGIENNFTLTVPGDLAQIK